MTRHLAHESGQLVNDDPGELLEQLRVEAEKDPQRLGNDFDLRLYNPYGYLVSSSSSYKDNNEVIEYNTTVSGNYTFKVRNYKWRNSANSVYIGLAIMWFSSTYSDHPR